MERRSLVIRGPRAGSETNTSLPVSNIVPVVANSCTVTCCVKPRSQYSTVHGATRVPDRREFLPVHGRLSPRAIRLYEDTIGPSSSGLGTRRKEGVGREGPRCQSSAPIPSRRCTREGTSEGADPPSAQVSTRIPLYRVFLVPTIWECNGSLVS